MSINSLVADFDLTVNESLANSAGLGNANVTHSSFNVQVTGNSSGTGASAAQIISEQTLAAASGTINLAALPTVNGAQDATTQKLRYIRINNRCAAHTFTIAVGGSNGYAIGGASIVVPPGGVAMLYFADGLLAVDSTHRTLDWTIGSYGSPDAVDISLVTG